MEILAVGSVLQGSMQREQVKMPISQSFWKGFDCILHKRLAEGLASNYHTWLLASLFPRALMQFPFLSPSTNLPVSPRKELVNTPSSPDFRLAAQGMDLYHLAVIINRSKINLQKLILMK